VKLKPSMWVSGGIWLGVLLVESWLLGRWPDEPSGFEEVWFVWYIATLVLTVAWGAALGWKGAWGWAMASVIVATVWSTLWYTVATYTAPDPNLDDFWLAGSILYLLVVNSVLIGLGAGLGAGGGALYRRRRARGVPRA
jgi:hypothetical protein